MRNFHFDFRKTKPCQRKINMSNGGGRFGRERKRKRSRRRRVQKQRAAGAERGQLTHGKRNTMGESEGEKGGRRELVNICFEAIGCLGKVVFIDRKFRSICCIFGDAEKMDLCGFFRLD